MFCLFNYRSIFLKELAQAWPPKSFRSTHQPMHRKTDITRNYSRPVLRSVNLDRKEQGGGAAVEGGEGGTFQNTIPRKLGHVFFRSNLRLEEESRFLFDAAASWAVAKFGGFGGGELDAVPRVRLSAGWDREQNTEGEKKNENRRGRRGKSTKRWVWVLAPWRVWNITWCNSCTHF